MLNYWHTVCSYGFKSHWMLDKLIDWIQGDNEMKHLGNNVFISVVALTLAAFIFGAAYADDAKTVMGTVNADNQIVAADGTVFEVADTDIGHQVLDLVGQTVKVTGTIEELEKTKIITITEYQIVQ